MATLSGSVTFSKWNVDETNIGRCVFYVRTIRVDE